MTLKYLFIATLLNGRKIKQTRADVCPTDSKRSAAWDLFLKDAAGNGITDADGKLVMRPDIQSFLLIGPEQKFLVDLTDGHFEIDGDRVGTIDGKPLVTPPPFVPLSLVYFRRRTEHFNPVSSNHMKSECEYHFGWKAASGHSQTLVLD